MELIIISGGLAVIVVFLLTRPPHDRSVRNRRQAVPENDAIEIFDSSSARPAQKPEVIRGSAYVIDGDTITISKTQVRLFGIDAPELDHPYGRKAKWAMVRLCKGQTVSAEITERDAYGRTVAKCSLPDGRDLSAELVRLGLALDWAKFSGGKYRHLESSDARKKLWLADARQKGRMHVWEQYETRKAKQAGNGYRAG